MDQARQIPIVGMRVGAIGWSAGLACFLAVATCSHAGAPYGDPNQPYDRLPGTLPSYHVKWATPLCGGKLRVLFLIPYFNSREVVELRQRLDLEYTVIMNGGKSVWAEGYREGPNASPVDNAAHVLDNLARERLDLRHKYDAILLAKVSWEAIPKEFRNFILEHVRRGTALVYVSPNRCAPGAWNADAPELTADDPQYASLFQRNLAPGAMQAIADSLPLDVMPLKTVTGRAEFEKLPPAPMLRPGVAVPAQQAVSVRVSKEGKGTVVALDYHDKGGRWNCYNSLTPFVDYDPVMYDYAYALLAKCVLLAISGEPKARAEISLPASLALPRPAEPQDGWGGKTPALAIERRRLCEARVQLRALSPRDFSGRMTLDFSLRNSKGVRLAGECFTVQAGAGKAALGEVRLPTLPQGLYFADLRILEPHGMVLDFASKCFRVETPLHISRIETDKGHYEKGDKIRARVVFSQPLSSLQRSNAEAIDRWGRIVFKAPMALSADRRSATFAIPVDFPLCRLWDLQVVISDEQGEIASATTWVGLPNWNFDEYFWPLIFSTTPDHDWKGYLYTEQARRYGINGANVYLIYSFMDLYEKYERAHLMSISYTEHLGQARAGHPLDKECSTSCMAELGRMARRIADSGQPLDPKEFPYQWGQWQLGAAWINDRVKAYKESLKFGSPYYFLTGEEYLSGEFANQENSCFCPLCTRNFQAWCRQQYKGDLTALNAEWGSGFQSWDQVRGILIREAVEKNQLPRWVAFRYFMRSRVWSQFFIDWTDMMRRVLGRDVLTGTNGHDHHDFSRYRNHMTSGKLYVGQETNAEWRGIVGEELRQSFSGDKSFLIAAQSQMTFNDDFQTPLNNRRLPWKMLFAGYRGFDWEQGLAQPSMGGMSCFTPDYSEPMPYLKNISDEVLRLQRGIGKLCITAKPLRSPVAILWSLPNHYISRLLPFQEQGFTGTWLYNLTVDGGAIADALAMMKSLRLRPTFIAPEDLVDGALEKRGFKALILAYNKGMSREEADAIRSFVHAGGLLIADNEPASYSRFGRKLDRGLLADLFPVTDKENLVKAGKGAAAYLPNSINGYLGRFEKCDYADSGPVASLLEKHAGVTPPVELIDSNGAPRRDTLMPVYLQGSARYVGLLRQSLSAGKEPEGTTLKLKGNTHVWEGRSGRYLGYGDRFPIRLDMEPKFLALLPANPTGIVLTAEPSCVRQGETLTLLGTVTLAGGTEPQLKEMVQVVHIEVSDPAGRELKWYRANQVFAGRTFTVALPVSYSEKPGTYTVTATHPVTGLKRQVVFTVAAVDSR